jgi:hypothetical protein
VIPKVNLTKRTLLIVLMSAVIVLLSWGLYLRFVKGFDWAEWTGFGHYTAPTGDYQRAKTLWDWMELFLVPSALALGAWLLNKTERERDERISDRQRQETALNEKDKQQEATLQTYFDQMTELLLMHGLRSSVRDSEVRTVSQVRTLTALRRLNSQRNRILLQFLRDLELIGSFLEGVPVIDMTGTDLSGVDLEHANLSYVSLRSCDLTGASLKGAYLTGGSFHEANLTDADFSNTLAQGVDFIGANFHHANFSDANLFTSKVGGPGMEMANWRGAIMPDGTEYEAWLASIEAARVVPNITST